MPFGSALIALRSGEIERFDAPEKLPGGNRTREIAKTLAATLAVGVAAGSLGGLGFGAYKLLQSQVQPQPQVY